MEHEDGISAIEAVVEGLSHSIKENDKFYNTQKWNIHQLQDTMKRTNPQIMNIGRELQDKITDNIFNKK